MVIAQVRDFPPGDRRYVDVGRTPVGIFNIDGEYYALRNRCPHQGAPLCQGMVTGTTAASQPYEYVYSRENEIIKCPWHGWEFEISSGKSVFNPHRVRVRPFEVAVEPFGDDEEDPGVPTFPVNVEDGWVVVYV